MAKARRATRAELIREGIELLLRGPSTEHDPLLDLVSSAGPAGRSDASDRHDELLYAAEEARPKWHRKSS
jgi:hypothetical protein